MAHRPTSAPVQSSFRLRRRRGRGLRLVLGRFDFRFLFSILRGLGLKLLLGSVGGLEERALGALLVALYNLDRGLDARLGELVVANRRLERLECLDRLGAVAGLGDAARRAELRSEREE